MAKSLKKYHVEFSPHAQKIIEKLDTKIRARIIEWIEKNLEGCENPRFQGKVLERVFTIVLSKYGCEKF